MNYDPLRCVSWAFETCRQNPEASLFLTIGAALMLWGLYNLARWIALTWRG